MISSLPKTGNGLKVIHKCQHYKKIFLKGQLVLVDLYHQFRGPDGRWAYHPAHSGVPGVVTGTRGNKFLVELFDTYFLNRKGRGKPVSDQLRLVRECTRAAKDIRPLMVQKEFSMMPEQQCEQQPTTTRLLN
ncbi:MAG: hypothetical protein RG741_04615 [Bacteroidales bacterium]|nr:hypothetical protein [Bacteroidales bacterium]